MGLAPCPRALEVKWFAREITYTQEQCSATGLTIPSHSPV